MSIKSDYILDTIKRIVESVTDMRSRDSSNPLDIAQNYEEIVGIVLDMDTSVAVSLVPEALDAMFSLSHIDESLVEYAVWGLNQASVLLTGIDDERATLRRQQAQYLARNYDIDIDEVPRGLQDVSR